MSYYKRCRKEDLSSTVTWTGVYGDHGPGPHKEGARFMRNLECATYYKLIGTGKLKKPRVPSITTKIDQELLVTLKTLAKKRRVSISTVVRTALVTYLANEACVGELLKQRLALSRFAEVAQAFKE